jgi:hypothetical protein
MNTPTPDRAYLAHKPSDQGGPPVPDPSDGKPLSPPRDPDGDPDFVDEPDLPEGEPSGAPTRNTKQRLPGER